MIEGGIVEQEAGSVISRAELLADLLELCGRLLEVEDERVEAHRGDLP